MKTIGLIGGLSWQSSQVYYQIINTRVNEILGGNHFAKCILLSVDFGEIAALQYKGDWSRLNDIMAKHGQSLQVAGADCILICANTMHLCSQAIIEKTSIPLIHIADVTAKSIASKGLKKVGLLGTKFTMEMSFYKDILASNGIETVIPNKTDREIVNEVIYKELVHGICSPDAKIKYQNVIKNLATEGAEGVILGCTEIPLLIKQEDVSIPTFDTTQIHSEAAVQFAVSTVI